MLSRLSGIPLKQLLAFDAVFRLRSIAAASEELNVTASALSHRLARFEDVVGSQLFIRRRGGTFATEAGVAVAEWVVPALASLSAAGRLISTSESAKLSVHVSPEVPLTPLLHRVPEFLDGISSPIRFSWSTTGSGERAGADVLLVPSATPDHTAGGLVLLRSSLRPPGTTALVERSGWFAQWSAATGIPVSSSRFIFDDPEPMVVACVHGTGYCVAPLAMVTVLLTAGRLQVAHPVRVPVNLLEVQLTPHGKLKALARRFATWAGTVLAEESRLASSAA